MHRRPKTSGFSGKSFVFAAHGNTYAFVRIDKDIEYYRPTTDLAIFDIALLWNGTINQDINGFATVWTLHGMFL